MKFSIITATYNSEKTLKDTIESILQQTYTNFEYIIIDGLSTDKTVEIIKSYESKFKEKNIPLTWISEKDTGVYNAWNKALKIVKSEWVVFIGSDDSFKGSNCFKKIYPYLQQAEKSKINLVYGKVEHINHNQEIFEYSGKPWIMQKKQFKNIMNIGHTGTFHHKNLFEKYGNFDESFKIAGDYDFLLRELKQKDSQALFIADIIIEMKEGGLSANLENRLVLVLESKRARKNNNLIHFSKEIFWWETKLRTLLFISNFIPSNKINNLADFYRSMLGKQKRWTN